MLNVRREMIKVNRQWPIVNSLLLTFGGFISHVYHFTFAVSLFIASHKARSQNALMHPVA